MKIAFFGSSLLSAYWNGAATYYRGIIRALHERGHHVTFFEPDAFDRQQHRDIEPPSWAEVVVYGNDPRSALQQLERASQSDIVVKASGVGVFDELLEKHVLDLKSEKTLVAFWDVDAPATLSRLRNDPADPFHDCIRYYDFIFTYGGGAPVTNEYRLFGAQACIPIYNAHDPDSHFPVSARRAFQADISFLGNRLPDREARVHEYLFSSARALPQKFFILGGNGWADVELPPNLQYRGHVYTEDHNVFNCSAIAVLNLSRSSMASTGFSPATRVFEAAAAGACIITDDWQGIEEFFEPDHEILVAKDSAHLIDIIRDLSPQKARTIGAAARARALRQHTYAQRALDVEKALRLEVVL